MTIKRETFTLALGTIPSFAILTEAEQLSGFAYAEHYGTPHPGEYEDCEYLHCRAGRLLDAQSREIDAQSATITELRDALAQEQQNSAATIERANDLGDAIGAALPYCNDTARNILEPALYGAAMDADA